MWHASPSAPSCSAEALQCWDTDSFLLRKGKLLWCGIPPKMQCILLPCCSLAALLRVSDFSFSWIFFLRVLLAVGCPVPWGHPPCTCQLGGGKHLLWVLFACYRGSFAEGSRGLLHLESTGACWSGLAVVTGCPSAAACPGHAPRDTFTLPQPRLPRGDTQCHPQLVRRATCFSANKI